MNLQQLREKRANLLREAEALKGATGEFKDDQTRAAFDGKTAEIEALDAQIRTAEAAERAATQPNQPAAEQIRAEERARITGIHVAGAHREADSAFGVTGATNWLLVRSGVAGLVAQHAKVDVDRSIRASSAACR
jgi:HK97 family phage major capsid protein